MDENVPNEEIPKESLFYVSGLYNFLCSVLENYGWIILIGGILLYYISTKYIEPFVANWNDKREQKLYSEKIHKNPDIFIQQQIQLEKARQKLQKEHDLRASAAEERRVEREEKKRKEWLAKQNPKIFGNRLDSENGYNPLMGEQTRSYRPTRRSGCPNGGCG